MTDWSPPREFESYRLVRSLGRGGMGEVYLAEDTLLDRAVAIKFILSAQSDVEARKRFLVEARAIARLQHPNVVAIFRIGVVEDRPFLVSEFVTGQPLSSIAKPLPWQRVLDIGMRIARALAAAHQRGVIHRDIKPANVMLTDEGEPKLLDFGIAKLIGGSASQLGESVPEPSAVQEPGGAAVQALAPAEEPDQLRQDRFDEPTSEVEVQASNFGSASDRPLTAVGTVVGTPRYMAPEVLQGQPVSCAADVYSLGALLYELCVGRPPRTAAEVKALQLGPLPGEPAPLGRFVPDIDPRFAEVVARCLVQEPARRYATGNEVRAALAQLTAEARSELVPAGNPYRGLRCFEAEHRGLFFGRDSEIRGVLDRLLGDPLVLVAGESGLGKSSLCRAGILPRVAQWFGPPRTWTSVGVVPGAHPVQALLAALGPLLADQAASVARGLDDDPSSLARALRKRLGSGEGVVVFVDQLEELATLSVPAEAALASEALAWLCEPSSCIRLLATVRSDFLGRVAPLPRFGDLAVRSLYFLRPLSESRIREAIVGPARALSVAFESESVVDSLVAWTVRATGGLPLLQFALAELWDARDPQRPVLTDELVQSLGGPAGALSRHADQVLASLTAPAREAARTVLTRLVTSERTRVRRLESELTSGDPQASRAIAALVQGRLIVASESHGGTGYELAHEAMIRAWGTLADWLASTEHLRIARERLETAAADWVRLGHRRDLLWTRRQLADVVPARLAPLTAQENAFLKASHAASLRARLLRIGGAALVPVLVASTWAIVSVQNRRQVTAHVERLEASAERRLDEARTLRQRVEGLRKDAFDAFDQRDDARGELHWASAIRAESELGPVLGDAGKLAENAWLLQPSRPHTRRLLAEVVNQRALATERRGDRAELAQLLERLTLYDDGSLQAQWFAPGRLRVVVTPSVARMTLESADGAGTEGMAGGIPVDPSRALSLRPGGYIATLQAPLHTAVRIPIVVRRDQEVALDVSLPRDGELPEGYVLVPAGRFLFGSAAEESLRRSFYRAVPVHETGTGTYLIAKHETTWADWIAYLGHLPLEARRQRLPRVGKGGFHGALELESLDDGTWRLSLQPADTPYVVRTGAPLVYRGRKVRLSQDWTRMPVTGISASDAEAYASWLSSSGRVRGARLCTELEWERAARGADGREYPNGASLAPDDANIDATYDKSPEGIGPDEVGSHPASRSPFGLDDMAGNAWEWTRSSIGVEGYVARGGSFYYDANAARASNREVPEAAFRDVTVGVRLCADVVSR